MFSPLLCPVDDTLTWPLNKWMYSFQSLQDQDQQQQILSRPTSLLVIDTITSQYSTVQRSPCEMENYRSNASPFGLGWRKSTHESPHTHTSLFPIPMQLVTTTTTTIPSAPTQVAITLLHGCDSMDCTALLVNSKYRSNSASHRS